MLHSTIPINHSLVFCSFFNQSQYISAILTVEVSCDWLICNSLNKNCLEDATLWQCQVIFTLRNFCKDERGLQSFQTKRTHCGAYGQFLPNIILYAAYSGFHQIGQLGCLRGPLLHCTALPGQLACLCNITRRVMDIRRVQQDKVYLFIISRKFEIFVCCNTLVPKSLHRSHSGSHFRGTEYEIWADFGPVGNTEKKLGADYEQLQRAFFSSFHGKKNQKYCIVRAKKLHNISFI